MQIEKLVKEVSEEISKLINQEIKLINIKKSSDFGTQLETPIGCIKGQFSLIKVFSVGYNLKGDITLNSLNESYNEIVKKIASEKKYNYTNKNESLFAPEIKY